MKNTSQFSRHLTKSWDDAGGGKELFSVAVAGGDPVKPPGFTLKEQVCKYVLTCSVLSTVNAGKGGGKGGEGGQGREMWRKFSRVFITSLEFLYLFVVRILLNPEGSSFKQMYVYAFWHITKHFSNLLTEYTAFTMEQKYKIKCFHYPELSEMPSIISKCGSVSSLSEIL